MAANIKIPGSETIEFNLKVENEVKRFFSLKTWTPVMGALLMSGIVPTNYWCKRLNTAGDASRNASVWTDQLEGLIHGLWESNGRDEEAIPDRNRRHLHGLDGEAFASPGSSRFRAARDLLRHWGYKCEDEGQYLSEIEPIIFLAWTEDMCLCEEIPLFDQTWLKAFLKLLTPVSEKTVLPTAVVQSFLQITDIRPDDGRHRLAPDILKAQREAVSRGCNPYAIEVIFPLLVHILDGRGAIDRRNEKYVSGKALPVTLADGGLHVLKRESLRVHLGRLKIKGGVSPQ